MPSSSKMFSKLFADYSPFLIFIYYLWSVCVPPHTTVYMTCASVEGMKHLSGIGSLQHLAEEGFLQLCLLKASGSVSFQFGLQI